MGGACASGLGHAHASYLGMCLTILSQAPVQQRTARSFMWALNLGGQLTNHSRQLFGLRLYFVRLLPFDHHADFRLGARGA